MAGHSKWKQIKRAKAITDSKRAVVFTKLGREITLAAKTGGGDPGGNARLRLAIQKARESNMPMDIIDRAIAKATGGGDDSQLEEITYEGYGPGGTAILVEAVTDNRNRTVAEVRNVFNHSGGNLAETGAVSWNFATRGVISIPADSVDSDEAALVAIDAGAEDFLVEGDTLSVHTKPEDLEPVRKALEENGYKAASSEVARIPNTTTTLASREALQTLKMLDKLEDLDDVQRVYTNADFPDEVLAEYEG